MGHVVQCILEQVAQVACVTTLPHSSSSFMLCVLPTMLTQLSFSETSVVLEPSPAANALQPLGVSTPIQYGIFSYYVFHLLIVAHLIRKKGKVRNKGHGAVARSKKLWDMKCKSRDQLKLIKQELHKAAEEHNNAAKEHNKATEEHDKANAALTQAQPELDTINMMIGALQKSLAASQQIYSNLTTDIQSPSDTIICAKHTVDKLMGALNYSTMCQAKLHEQVTAIVTGMHMCVCVCELCVHLAN